MAHRLRAAQGNLVRIHSAARAGRGAGPVVGIGRDMSTLIDSAVPDAPPDMRFYGVAIAEVVSNIDESGLGRVQLRLPWLPGYQPWARVAVLSAGSNRGTYFIPQTGDEV